jgi:GNAT superfamily N-acetyltransferase
MAAVTVPVPETRPPRLGEGAAIARLWRELWDVHESWGGYPGQRDPRAYDRVAERIDADTRVRGNRPTLGRHVHLVADLGGKPVGQVEGWFDRYGVDPLTPYTCEVRSLIVTEEARTWGAGRGLLEGLANSASDLARGAPVVLAAEVLEPNPAHTFYERVGYRPIAWSVRVGAHGIPAVISPIELGGWTARVADATDALAVALLEAILAERRRAVGDARFDPPRQVEASLLQALASHLSRGSGAPPVELVVTGRDGRARASATLVTNRLDPPFVIQTRAILARVAVDPALPPGPLLRPLVTLARRVSAFFGAGWMEITDLTAPGTPLHDAALATGATPWSRIVARFAR